MEHVARGRLRGLEGGEVGARPGRRREGVDPEGRGDGRVVAAAERRAVQREARLGRKRVIQVLFNMSVPRARGPEKASTLRDRSER